MPDTPHPPTPAEAADLGRCDPTDCVCRDQPCAYALTRPGADMAARMTRCVDAGLAAAQERAQRERAQSVLPVRGVSFAEAAHNLSEFQKYLHDHFEKGTRG